MFLVGKITLVIEEFFKVGNIKRHIQMNASEFENMLL